MYFIGAGRGGARWSQNELDAVPLFFPAAVGELSVRWNPMLRAWVMMYMSGLDDPIGFAASLRLSRTPWGPWSNRRRMLDWIADGMGSRVGHKTRQGWSIHAPDADPPVGLWQKTRDVVPCPDTLYDNIINGRDAKEGGAAYAPYQIPRHTRYDEGAIHIFYVLSTWNPYQTVLLRHPITYFERNVMLNSWFTDSITSVVRALRRIRERLAKFLVRLVSQISA